MYAANPTRDLVPGTHPGFHAAGFQTANLQNDSEPIDPRRLREALGRFATGVTVITADSPDSAGGAGLAGLTANAFTAVSLDPPLLLVCVKTASRSLGVIRAAGGFAVHVLAAEDEPLAKAFASSNGDKFAGLELSFSRFGTPRLPRYLARFDCALEREYAGGDHRILIGRVLDTEIAEPGTGPLIFYRSHLGRHG